MKGEHAVALTEAQQNLVVKHSKLVYRFLFKRFKRRRLGEIFSCTYSDLAQEARIGLCMAAQRWDSSWGTCFSTYAWHWMRQRVNRYLPKNTAVFRHPDYLFWRKSKENQSFPSVVETDLDTLPRTEHIKPDICCGKNINMLRDALDVLTDRELYVVAYRFGAEERTLERIGNKLRLTKERVRQIELAALRKLRRFYKCKEAEERCKF